MINVSHKNSNSKFSKHYLTLINQNHRLQSSANCKTRAFHWNSNSSFICMTINSRSSKFPTHFPFKKNSPSKLFTPASNFDSQKPIKDEVDVLRGIFVRGYRSGVFGASARAAQDLGGVAPGRPGRSHQEAAIARLQRLLRRRGGRRRRRRQPRIHTSWWDDFFSHFLFLSRVVIDPVGATTISFWVVMGMELLRPFYSTTTCRWRLFFMCAESVIKGGVFSRWNMCGWLERKIELIHFVFEE